MAPWPSARLAARGRTNCGRLAAANALAFLPDGDGVAAGERVEVMVLDPDGMFAGRPEDAG